MAPMLRVLRCCVAAALATALGAAEPPALLPSLSLEAGDGGAFSLRPDAPSQLRGGVRALYEGGRLACDSLVFTRSPYADSREPVLSEADIGSGPLGPNLAGVPVVELDTRQATSPRIGFRGLLTPGQVHVSRLPASDPRRPGLVSFAVTLIPLGAFAGELRQNGVWRPYHGWAERGEATVVADLGRNGLENPRFAAIRLFGRPAQEGHARERAWLVGPRPTQMSPSATHGAVADAPVVPSRAEAMDFTLGFDDQGGFRDLIPGRDFRLVDLPAAPAASATGGPAAP